MWQEPHDHERDHHDGSADQEHQVHRLGEADQEWSGQAWVELLDERGVVQRVHPDSASLGLLQTVDECGVGRGAAGEGLRILERCLNPWVRATVPKAVAIRSGTAENK